MIDRQGPCGVMVDIVALSSLKKWRKLNIINYLNIKTNSLSVLKIHPFSISMAIFFNIVVLTLAKLTVFRVMITGFFFVIKADTRFHLQAVVKA